MTTWARVIDLYIDLDAIGSGTTPLVNPLSNGRAPTPQFVQSDKFPLRLHFMRYDNDAAAWAAEDLPDGSAIVMAAKQDAADDFLLFSLTDWTDDADDYGAFYEGKLNLNTEPLTGTGDAVATYANGFLTAKADVEIQNADNSERTTFQFDVRINQQRFSDEGDPVAADPSYPAASSLVLKRAGAQDLAVGTKTYYISLASFALTAAPDAVLLTVEKPDAAADMIFANAYTITAAQVAYELSAAPTESGYKLHYLIIA